MSIASQTTAYSWRRSTPRLVPRDRRGRMALVAPGTPVAASPSAQSSCPDSSLHCADEKYGQPPLPSSTDGEGRARADIELAGAPCTCLRELEGGRSEVRPWRELRRTQEPGEKLPQHPLHNCQIRGGPGFQASRRPIRTPC
jgi:hypothetical protein